MQSGNRCWTERKRERKDKVFVISAAESMSMKSRRNNTKSHSLRTHRGFYSDERDLREHLERRDQQDFQGENSVQRKWQSTKYDMEVQNLERRNSEYAFSSHSVSLNLKDYNCWKPINGQIKPSVREYTCVVNWRWRAVFCKGMLREKLTRIWRIDKTLLSRGKYWITTKIGRMSCAAWSGIAHSESIERDQVRRLQERLVYNEDSKKTSMILTHRAVLTVSTFLIKLLLPRVQESLAAKLECCDMHETIRVFLETFLIVNKLDEILMNYRFVQENWQHYSRIWEQKELRKFRAKNYGNQHFTLLSNRKQDKKSRRVESVQCLWLTMPRVLGLVLKAWQFRVISPRKCICKNSSTKQNVRAGSWMSEQKFTQRLVTKGEGQTFLTRKIGELSLVQMETFAISAQACHGRPWDYVERSGRRKEISPRTSILFSTKSEGTDWREKLKQTKGQYCD